MSLLVLSCALITTPDESRRALRVCRVTRVLPSAMRKDLWIKSIPRLLMLVRTHRFGTMIKRTKAQCVLADKAYANKANRAALKGKHRDGILHKAIRCRPLHQSEKRFNKLIPKQRFGVEQCFGSMKRLFGLYRVRYFGVTKTHAQMVMAPSRRPCSRPQTRSP